MEEFRLDGLTVKEHLLILAEEGNRKFTEGLHPGRGASPGGGTCVGHSFAGVAETGCKDCQGRLGALL